MSDGVLPAEDEVARVFWALDMISFFLWNWIWGRGGYQFRIGNIPPERKREKVKEAEVNNTHNHISGFEGLSICLFSVGRRGRTFGHFQPPPIPHSSTFTTHASNAQNESEERED